METKWYQKPAAIVILLILFFPAGLFLMWKYAKWDKKVKWTLTVVSILLFFSVMGTAPHQNAQKSVENKKVEKPKKHITYEVVRRWDIPNGGEGKVILIPTEYFNTNDMPLVGEKLRDDTKNDRNAFISVFTDRKAAEMREKVLNDELTETDRDFYDMHYVGQYTRNINSGYNEFVIYYDGVLGTNSKIVKY